MTAEVHDLKDLYSNFTAGSTQNENSQNKKSTQSQLSYNDIKKIYIYIFICIKISVTGCSLVLFIFEREGVHVSLVISVAA